jgi:hypothetical protein
MRADLRESQRLLHSGMKLVKLERLLKKPEGLAWNTPANWARSIDPRATGYGLPLEANRLCSIDPDNWALAVKGMKALGFDLEALMNAGTRTTSTRPGSGGRSAFQAEGEIGWLRFKSKATGTVLELRAHSPNLQDCVPGLLYRTKDGGGPFTQEYANGKRLDEAPPLPDDLMEWWERCSTDLKFLHEQERRFFEALGIRPAFAISASRARDGAAVQLAYPSKHRTRFNERHKVTDVLARHGYSFHEWEKRWSPPSATGAPGVREIPGRDGLWASDHASDPLAGIFDAWTASVVLDHDGNLKAAEDAFALELALEVFEPGTPAETSPPGEQVQRFKLLGSADLKALPPMSWRIREVFPAEGLAAVYGPSRSGKSFLLLDAACAIAEGRDWFGYRVKAAPVVYVALEGQAGFRVRVRAWEQANGRALPERLRLVLEPFKLVEPRDVRDLAAAILAFGPGSVTILDTLNRAAPGLDENASADMGRMIEAAASLQRLIGGLVVLVHHTGKDATRGLRGHSSLIGALDGSVEVTRDGERRTWNSDKVKEGPDGKAHAFRLESVEVGTDEDGEPETSCVVRSDTSTEEIKRVKLPQGGNQRIVYQALGPMFRASLKLGMCGAPSYRPCLELEAAITAAAGHLTCASDRRLERAREAITGLVSRGVLACREGWIWLV